MFQYIFRAEFDKVIRSNMFKIAFIGILLFLVLRIISEYRCFPHYTSFSHQYRKEYIDEIRSAEEFLENYTVDPYFQEHVEELQSELENRHRVLEFYKEHKLSDLNKDFSQGLSKSIFYDHEFLPVIRLLILLFCCESICYEKSKNITAMQFSSRVSKEELYFAKLLSLWASVTLIFVVNLGISIVLSGTLVL